MAVNNFRNPAEDKLQFANELFAIPEFESRTRIKFKRTGLEGRVVGYEETTFHELANDSNSKNSLSLNRETGSRLDFVRGRAGFMPFAPGGVEMDEVSQPDKYTLHRDSQGVFDIPPGLSRGLQTGASVSNEESKELNEKADEEEDESNEEEEEEEEEDSSPAVLTQSQNRINSAVEKNVELSAVDDLLPVELSFGRTKSVFMDATAAARAKEWAHMVDVNKTITNFHELVPTPAAEFPFELDTFQKEAVYHLEQGDSVFVAAHTSAGKTVVAEYAIGMARRNMTKVIYTSPIKALSNQKYRDFKDIYEDVGILTGDVQINPEASCLIMTTEILRSMLYRGADLIRDVEFVIFDEVHYVNDQDRGVVWEEVIIMLPDHIKFIMLSATVPNTFEFANWIGRTKQKDIYVISTPKRPVPLVHYLWAKNKIYEIVDSNKKFLEKGYKEAENALSNNKEGGTSAPSTRGGANGGGRGGSRGGGRGGGGAQRGGRGGSNSAAVVKKQINSNVGGRRMNVNLPGKTAFTQLCQHLNKKNLLPVVIFVFSKKRCEENALMLSGLDYCNAKEKSEIHMFIDKAVARLKKEDRELPQIMRVRDLLSRGIGVHHGGLLPIVKEVIEILFAKSLVKVLFATETFAMGLNLPTRTVVFSGTRKHDGHDFRNLLAGEYTQMAGRAGRRGLDSIGTVIIMATGEVPPMNGLKDMMLGTPTKLQSQFRLTYNMILNLLRIEALKVEEMIKRSFSENASQVMLPEHEKNVKLNEDTLQNMKRDSCDVCDNDLETMHQKVIEYRSAGQELLKLVSQTPVGRGLLGPGRLVIFQQGNGPRELGIVVRLSTAKNQIHVLACSKYDPNAKDTVPFLSMVDGFVKNNVRPFSLAKGFKPKFIDYSDVEFFPSIMVKTTVADVLKGGKKATEEAMSQVSHALQYQKKWKEVNYNRFKKAEIQELIKEREEAVKAISKCQCIKCPKFIKHYTQIHDEHLIRKKIDDLKNLISDQNLELLPDYEQRVAVLKELSYIDENSNVQLKGRVACELTSGFELIVTELLLDNFLGDYEPEEIVALLSAFVFEGNTKEEPETVTPRLDNGKKRILEIVNNVNTVFEKHQVLVTQEEAEFAERKRFGLMEAVYEWARGMSFNSITELTDVPEGTIVRVITRLDEVCRQVMSASRIIGDARLYEKMEIAQEKIKRDIVFCASLYL
ncbi:hypothetical protein TRICI_006895 [Trichomonascus ciferrii]|uniref:Antiviral helicase SKI2 n=1 Tax=Trichomonascus ciferrii TaxID=44093 RepID=A0A642UBU4_9ASCO|nr:hypothetical protein TRICI_006895 [Trichomonascus ciferrii]